MAVCSVNYNTIVPYFASFFSSRDWHHIPTPILMRKIKKENNWIYDVGAEQCWYLSTFVFPVCLFKNTILAFQQGFHCGSFFTQSLNIKAVVSTTIQAAIKPAGQQRQKDHLSKAPSNKTASGTKKTMNSAGGKYPWGELSTTRALLLNRCFLHSPLDLPWKPVEPGFRPLKQILEQAGSWGSKWSLRNPNLNS